MRTERIDKIVRRAVAVLYAQIRGGRIPCESEATLQLHLSRIISLVGDLEMVHARETLAVELEKPFSSSSGERGRIDIWFAITNPETGIERCAIELKFFKEANHREPNNRYEVFKDMARLERCGAIADMAFMFVVTDHDHYSHRQRAYSVMTSDFDFRHGKTYRSGTEMTYRTGGMGPPITLAGDYQFSWEGGADGLRYLLAEVAPREAPGPAAPLVLAENKHH
jgi:hypothetical protein